MVFPGVINVEEKLKLARKMRKNPTTAEALFWKFVRRDVLGFRVRRQTRIHGFIADFYIPKLRLVIEIDGGYHQTEERSTYDAKRTNILNNYGFTVIRFTNNEVIYNVRSVIQKILVFDKTRQS